MSKFKFFVLCSLECFGLDLRLAHLPNTRTVHMHYRRRKDETSCDMMQLLLVSEKHSNYLKNDSSY